MKSQFFGISFPHRNGDFCTKSVSEYYSLYYFYTDFLYEVDGEMKLGKKGEMLLIPPNCTVYHGPVDRNTSFTNDWIYMSENDEIAELLKKYPIPQNEAFEIENKNILNQALREIEMENALKRKGYTDKIDMILRSLIIDVHRGYYHANYNKKTDAKIERVREELMLKPEKQWSLPQMAILSGYSPSRFSALYNKIYGISPKADLLRIRISKAKRMLCYSGISITEISESCGFQSIYYFSKYFKAVTGYSPNEYKKKN